jgi:archaellum component FlaF (FlaF/FlaG flagellin family)
MGFSLIASAAILGVTLFMAAEIITSDLLPTIEGINDSYGDMKNRLKNQIQSDINITGVTRLANGTNYDYNISVENTGSVTLKTEDFMILINGTLYQKICSHMYLYPKNTLFFQVFNVTGTDETRIKVITNNGIADYYEYIS